MAKKRQPQVSPPQLPRPRLLRGVPERDARGGGHGHAALLHPPMPRSRTIGPSKPKGGSFSWPKMKALFFVGLAPKWPQDLMGPTLNQTEEVDARRLAGSGFVVAWLTCHFRASAAGTGCSKPQPNVLTSVCVCVVFEGTLFRHKLLLFD